MTAAASEVCITVNGEAHAAPAGTTVAELLETLGMDPQRIAIERNHQVIPRRTWTSATIADGDELEIVAFVGGGSGAPAGGAGAVASAAAADAADADDDEDEGDRLVIAGRSFGSRLLVGTGKYRTLDEGREAIRRSGAEIVTVALRRVDLTPGKPSVLDTIDRARQSILPNTAGCSTVDEAVRTCRLSRELGMSDMVKLEVIGDPRTLFPDNEATLQAAAILAKEGFVVLPYCLDDPILARKLEDVGCAAIMPLAAPIGSGLGIRNPYNILIILERARIPVIVDAGVGTASDAAVAMELGCQGVLMNTAIAEARNPLLMAEAMRDAVIAGRKAFRAGRMPRRLYAHASSPLGGLIE